jgi:hypothetical protein
MKREGVVVRGRAVMLSIQETKLYDCGGGDLSLAEFNDNGRRRIPADRDPDYVELRLSRPDAAINMGSDYYQELTSLSRLPIGDGDGRWYTLPAGGRRCVGNTIVSLM